MGISNYFFPVSGETQCLLRYRKILISGVSAASAVLRVSLYSRLLRCLLFFLLSLGWSEGTAQTAYPGSATRAGGPY